MSIKDHRFFITYTEQRVSQRTLSFEELEDLLAQGTTAKIEDFVERDEDGDFYTYDDQAMATAIMDALSKGAYISGGYYDQDWLEHSSYVDECETRLEWVE